MLIYITGTGYWARNASENASLSAFIHCINIGNFGTLPHPMVHLFLAHLRESNLWAKSCQKRKSNCMTASW